MASRPRSIATDEEATINCTSCGRIGVVTGVFMEVGGSDPGTYFERVEGLDPENCAGCRLAARHAGFLLAVFSVRAIDPASEANGHTRQAGQ